jgi:hypothetical protein
MFINFERIFIRSLGNIESISLFSDLNNYVRNSISLAKLAFSSFISPLYLHLNTISCQKVWNINRVLAASLMRELMSPKPIFNAFICRDTSSTLENYPFSMIVHYSMEITIFFLKFSYKLSDSSPLSMHMCCSFY